jgi:hypothetical protein
MNGVTHIDPLVPVFGAVRTRCWRRCSITPSQQIEFESLSDSQLNRKTPLYFC